MTSTNTHGSELGIVVCAGLIVFATAVTMLHMHRVVSDRHLQLSNSVRPGSMT